jgi:hypothetical protein
MDFAVNSGDSFEPFSYRLDDEIGEERQIFGSTIDVGLGAFATKRWACYAGGVVDEF